MVRLTFIHAENNHVNDRIFSIPLGVGLFIVVSAIVALCAKHGKRARASSPKEASKSSIDINNSFDSVDEDYSQGKIPPRSPLRSPRQLIATISNKAMSSFVVNHKRSGDDGGGKVVDEGFGQGGLWQKEILMGVKCQPPEFSGVIYYDYNGHQVSEFPPKSPRSPRIARSPEFTFPMVKTSVV